MKKTSIKSLLEKGTQQASVFFGYTVEEIIEEKQTLKGKKLDNGMEITGIGKKCLKVGNNFYNWEDIEYAALDAKNDEEIDDVIKSIIRFFFTEKYEEEKIEEYNPRKFTRAEFLENFDEIKQEIIKHKEYYRTGFITGIGEKSIMVGRGYESEYIPWSKIKEILTENTVRDALLFQRGYDEEKIINHFFILEEDEHLNSLLEKEVEYAEEKAYIYRHLITDDLTVENIRKVIYKRGGGSEVCEDIITECMQYAFKYIDEIKFTDDPLTDEEDNKYAIPTKGGYFYTIKNKEIVYDEEQEGYIFKEYPHAVFKPVDTLRIDVYREGKKVGGMPHARKPVYVTVLKKADLTYELSVEQQAKILEKAPHVKKVTDEEIKEDFLQFIETDNAMADEIRETILEQYPRDFNIQKEYENSKALRNMAEVLYGEGRILQQEFYYALNAISLEPRIQSDRIIDFIMYDDSSMSKYALADDRHGFSDYSSERVTLSAGLASKEYSVAYKEGVTRVENSEAYIDTFAGGVCYIEGNISKKDAILYFEYAKGLAFTRDFKHHLVWRQDKMTIKI